ncbi:MAG TPA: hypothetical protein VNJ12_01870 [Candidatus Dormibacteraeota bacterium]|nr:hypothetical protein [Candidatus Dormibacteraeota bacterium]
MKRRIPIVALALLLAAPLLAQVPKGWMYRVDRSTTAADPDAPGPVKLIPAGSGFRAVNPQAAIYWKPADTTAGNYSVKATFTLIQNTGHIEYYGLLFGGSDLAGAGQNYLYFIIAPNGTWLIKKRTGDSTESLSAKTPSSAVKKPDAGGKSTNTLEVRVGTGNIQFLVNGTLVDTLPQTGLAGKTGGVYGFRINHHLIVQVDGFGISKP